MKKMLFVTIMLLACSKSFALCGVVNSYSEQRGFGYISRDSQQKSIFASYNAVTDTTEAGRPLYPQKLIVGEKVVFDVVTDTAGGMHALNIKVVRTFPINCK